MLLVIKVTWILQDNPHFSNVLQFQSRAPFSHVYVFVSIYRHFKGIGFCSQKCFKERLLWMNSGMTKNTAQTLHITLFKTFQLFIQDRETIPWACVTKLWTVKKSCLITLDLYKEIMSFFTSSIQWSLDIQRKLDIVSHDMILGKKANLILIKLGKMKSFNSGTNIKLFCDAVGNRKILLNIIHLSFKQAKLL